MKTSHFLVIATFVLMGAVTGTALADEHPGAEHPKAEHPQGPGDLLAVATASGQFTTLLQAIKAADIVDALRGAEPLTVLAPTDDAFKKLPQDALRNLLKPENREMLKAILAYHLIPGKLMAADVKTSKTKTVNGQEVSFKVEKGDVLVDKAKIVKADIAASNGVIHVIDAVLFPAVPKMKTDEAKPKDHPGH